MPDSIGHICVLGGAAPAAGALTARLEGLGLAVTLCGAEIADGQGAGIVLLSGGEAACDRLAGFRLSGGRNPVLALAAPAHAAALLRAGADAVLEPDCCDRELLASLSALSRRARACAEGSNRQSAEQPGLSVPHDLKLTPTEQRILELLARRPGRVVTRDLIVDTLYAGADAPRSTTVDVFVHGLRRKLGGRETGYRIETVRGSGFRLSAG